MLFFGCRVSNEQNPSTPTIHSYTNAAFDDEEAKVNNNNVVDVCLAKTIGVGDTGVDIKSEDQPERTKRSVWKNLLAIGFGFFFLFLSVTALTDLQSSLNPDEGMGTTALSATFACVLLSCMFVPSYIISSLGCKWTLVVMAFLHCTFIAANFYAIWGTLIPSAIILGLSSAPLWIAKCTYLSKMGAEYGQSIGKDPDPIIVHLFGFFFMMVHCGRIAGNLISSLILNWKAEGVILDEQLQICGTNYCNQPLPYYAENSSQPFNASTDDNSLAIAGRPDNDKVTLLCGIYLASGLIGVAIFAIGVDPLTIAEGGREKKKEHQGNLSLFVATFRQMKKANQLLIIPLTTYGGLQQGFIVGDFTKAFITCSLGIDKVGFVMVCFSFFDAMGSVSFGTVIKKFGRLPVYLATTVANVTVSIVFLTWLPNPSHFIVYFVLAALWGMSDAIWLTQNSAFYGVIFTDNEEAAFSNYLLWESIGFIISFGCSNYLCMNVKIYLVLCFLFVGMTGYLIIEYNLRKDNKNSKA